MSCDFSCDSAPAVQIWPHSYCTRSPHTRQCVAMPIISRDILHPVSPINITRSILDPFSPCGGWDWDRDYHDSANFKVQVMGVVMIICSVRRSEHVQIVSKRYPEHFNTSTFDKMMVLPIILCAL